MDFNSIFPNSAEDADPNRRKPEPEPVSLPPGWNNKAVIEAMEVVTDRVHGLAAALRGLVDEMWKDNGR